MSELSKEYFEKQFRLQKEHFEEKIEELAQSVAVGFRGVDERFDRVDVRLDKVESRLDKVEGRLDKVENRLQNVESQVGDLVMGQKELVKSVSALEKRNQKENQETTLLRGLYHRLDDRVTKLESAGA